jgi:hypothetical protein
VPARRLLFQLHLWIGVTTGLYIFVVCTTGAALVFRIDMQRALYPDLFTASVTGPLADPVVSPEPSSGGPAARIGGAASASTSPASGNA